MKPKKKLFFIVNETSGSGKARFIEEIVKSLQTDYSFTAELHKTVSAGHAPALARSLAEKVDKEQSNAILVTVGGDGTLNEVISGLGSDYPQVPIGFIPTGSGNDFARTHQLALKPESALKHILELDEPRLLDVLNYTDMKTGKAGFAVNSLGIGIDATVIHLLNQTKLKKRMAKSGLGKSSYLSAAISAFSQQSPFSVTYETNGNKRTIEESILTLCSNNPYLGGGIRLSPHSSPTDALLELVIAEKLSFGELLKLLYLVLKNGRHLDHPKVHLMISKEFTVHIHQPQYGQKDGEEIEKDAHYYKFSTFKQAFWL